MHFCQYLSIFLLFVPLCFGLPFESANNTDAERHHPGCRDLQGANELDTLQVRLDCDSVFEDEYVKWSESMLSGHGAPSFSSRIKREAGGSTCPTFTREYLSRSTMPNHRSMSPWTLISTANPNRIPRTLLTARCLRQGCVDFTTRIENTSNRASVPVTRRTKVMINSRVASVYVPIACTCIALNDIDAN